MVKERKTPDCVLPLIATVLALLLTGCAAQYLTDVRPPQGILVTSIKAPLTCDFHNTDVNTDDLKVAKRKTNYFSGFLITGLDFAWGEVDVPEIARRAGINEVCFAEYEILNVLGIYAEFTVYVYGR